MPGVILIYLLIFLSQDGDLYEKKIGSKLLANYIHLFEMILMMEQFLKQHEFERSSIILMKDHVTAIFNLYKDTVNIKVGMGDNLIKIHLIRHIADDILNLGLPISFDSAPGENRHISAVKIPASRTQHQMHTFYEQIGMRVAEDIAIDRGYYDIECTLDHFKSFAIKDKEDKQLRNQTYRVTHDAIEKKVKNNIYKYEKWKDEDLYIRILNYFKEKVFPYTEQKEILVFTEYAIQSEKEIPTEIYRADLLYKHGGWNDWVYVNWDEYGYIPARILMFFEINYWNDGCISECNDTYIIQPGNYALCYMIAEQLDDDIDNPKKHFRAHTSSFLVKCAKLMTEKDHYSNKVVPIFGTIEISSFSAPCIAVPYDINQSTDKFNYLFVEPRSIWTEIFVKFLRNEIKIME
jgi:hypothetical protein